MNQALKFTKVPCLREFVPAPIVTEDVIRACVEETTPDLITDAVISHIGKNPPLDGKDGETGEPGRRGRRGVRGLPPGHEIIQTEDGYSLRFHLPDGDWGAFVRLENGVNGEDGSLGEPGEKGLHGRQGLIGPKGEKGEKGETGPAPDHEWKETRLRFRNPDNSWGRFVNIQGQAGMAGGRGSSANQGYDSITHNNNVLSFTRSTAGPLGPSLDVSFLLKVTTVITTTHTSSLNEDVILVDDTTAGGPVTVNLITAVGNEGKRYYIKKIGVTANVTIDGNASEEVDGALTAVLTAQFESVTIVSDNSDWFVI